MTIDPPLERIGFVLVGHVMIRRPSTFVVEFDVHPEAKWWPAVIYAFRVGNEVARIGKSEDILCGRMKRWERDVSRALVGNYGRGRTSPWEAGQWRKLLKSRRGELLVLRIDPPDVESLKRREKELIKHYDPPLCGDSPSARRRRRRR